MRGKERQGMRTVTNVVKPGTAERLANAKKRIAAEAAGRRAVKANPATARTVARAAEASRKAKCARRNGRGI